MGLVHVDRTDQGRMFIEGSSELRILVEYGRLLDVQHSTSKRHADMRFCAMNLCLRSVIGHIKGWESGVLYLGVGSPGVVASS